MCMCRALYLTPHSAERSLYATRRDGTNQAVVLAPASPSGLMTVEAYLPVRADGSASFYVILYVYSTHSFPFPPAISLSGAALSPSLAIYIVGYVSMTPQPITSPPLFTTPPPPSTTPAPSVPSPSPTQPNTQPTGVPTIIPCVTPPPVNGAVCVGGAWWVPRYATLLSGAICSPVLCSQL